MRRKIIKYEKANESSPSKPFTTATFEKARRESQHVALLSSTPRSRPPSSPHDWQRKLTPRPRPPSPFTSKTLRCFLPYPAPRLPHHGTPPNTHPHDLEYTFPCAWRVVTPPASHTPPLRPAPPPPPAGYGRGCRGARVGFFPQGRKPGFVKVRLGAAPRCRCVSTPFIGVSYHDSFLAYVARRMAAVYQLFSNDGKLLVKLAGKRTVQSNMRRGS